MTHFIPVCYYWTLVRESAGHSFLLIEFHNIDDRVSLHFANHSKNIMTDSLEQVLFTGYSQNSVNTVWNLKILEIDDSDMLSATDKFDLSLINFIIFL